MAIDTINDLFDAARVVIGPGVEPVHLASGRLQTPVTTMHWLPAVSTSGAALDDPQGWYQQTLNADAAVSRVHVLPLAVSSFSAEERRETHVFTRHTLERRVGQVRPFALPADSYSWAAPSWSMLVKAVAMQLWAPFAVVICPREDTAFYEHVGWQLPEASIQCEQPGGRVTLEGEVALSLPCQGVDAWPSGPIDLLGEPW